VTGAQLSFQRFRLDYRRSHCFLHTR